MGENKDYKFPAIRGTQSGEKAWAENPSSLLPMKETDKISGDTLYAINKLEDPVIEYGEGIDKTYDGETNVLNVVAKHPNAKKLAEAKGKSGCSILLYLELGYYKRDPCGRTRL